jgi:hypothetical protein
MVIDFCIPFSKRLIFLTSEDYSVEDNVLLGADETLAVSFGFYSTFFSSCGFDFLPNWIDGILFDYFLPETTEKISLSKILPSGPVPSIS